MGSACLTACHKLFLIVFFCIFSRKNSFALHIFAFSTFHLMKLPEKITNCLLSPSIDRNKNSTLNAVFFYNGNTLNQFQRDI